jgi:hypothetical protein
MEFIPLVTKMQAIKAKLYETARGSQKASDKELLKTPLLRLL